MRFVFDERKAAQSAAHLLRRNSGQMDAIRLIKLLYLADRRAFIETGYPITGDTFISMHHGPALSRILDLLAWGEQSPGDWHEHISEPARHVVMLLGESDGSELSTYDEEILDRTDEDFRGMSKWALTAYTQTLPEWSDPGEAAVPVDMRIILQDAGRSNEEIREIADQVGAIRAFRTASVIASESR